MSVHLAQLPRKPESDTANCENTLTLCQESIQKWLLKVSVIYEVEKGDHDAKRETRNFHFLLHVHRGLYKITQDTRFVYMSEGLWPWKEQCKWYQKNSDCEHKQQSLSTQIQLTCKSKYKNHTGFWEIASRIWGFLSFFEGGGYKELFFSPNTRESTIWLCFIPKAEVNPKRLTFSTSFP